MVWENPGSIFTTARPMLGRGPLLRPLVRDFSCRRILPPPCLAQLSCVEVQLSLHRYGGGREASSSPFPGQTAAIGHDRPQPEAPFTGAAVFGQGMDAPEPSQADADNIEVNNFATPCGHALCKCTCIRGQTIFQAYGHM